MKKHIILALFLALAVTGAFAKGTDVGAGILFNWGSHSYERSLRGGDFWGSSDTYTEVSHMSDFGLYSFVGWKFFDIDLGVTFRDFKYSYPGTSPDGEKAVLKTFFVQTGFNFKVPINILWWFRIFPTLGLSVGYGTVFELATRAGMGMDFLVWKNMFVRGIFAYDFNLFPWIYPACFNMKFAVGWLL